MANVLAELFQNIANEIKLKTGDNSLMKPLEFPEKIHSINTGTAKLVPLTVTENGIYIPNKTFDPSGGTYRFKESYTQEELSVLYAQASAAYEFPMNDFATGAFLIDNEDDQSTALAVVRFTLGSNSFYCLMKNGAEPKVWGPVEVASVLGHSSEGWYTVTDANTMALTPCDIPEYPIVSGATYIVSMDDIALLFDCDDIDGYSSVTVDVKNSGSVEDAVVWNVTFIGADGSTLCQKLCLDGDACYDPVITEKISTPTKESTPQYTFAYNGWSLTDGGAADGNALSAVTSDRTVYAAFEENLVYYTVRFFDGDILMKTERVAYGEKATPPDTEKGGGFTFDGWTPSDLKITGDTDFYGTWTESTKLEAYTWAEIAAISESGEAQNKFFLGDTKTFTTTDGKTYTAQIIGFNHDDLTSGSGKAGISFLMTNATAETYAMTTKGYDSTGRGGCWEHSNLRTITNNTIYGSFPDELKAAIKTVKKLSRQSFGPVVREKIATNDNCWILSVGEVDDSNYLYEDGTEYQFLQEHPSVLVCSSACWLRSGSSSNSNYMTKIYAGGTLPTTGSTLAAGGTTKLPLRFGFCI
jgi:hypothetical protein